MSTAPDLAELDAVLDTTLAALIRRAEVGTGADSGMVSFGVGEEGGAATPEVEELWQMVALARGQGSGGRTGEGTDEAMVSFEAGEGATSEGAAGMLARIRRESSELVTGLLSALIDPHVIETGEGPTRIRTRVGWLGDTSTALARGVTPQLVAAHVAATAAELDTSAERLHVLAMVLSTASKIAAVIAAPGGAVMALPIAYKCVREAHRRWSASHRVGPNSG